METGLTIVVKRSKLNESVKHETKSNVSDISYAIWEKQVINKFEIKASQDAKIDYIFVTNYASHFFIIDHKW